MIDNLMCNFIKDKEIIESLKYGEELAESKEDVIAILEKAKQCKGLTHQEASVLLHVENQAIWEQIFQYAKEVKEHIYGKRIVLFAPLYVSNFCINNCDYCGYKHSNSNVIRRKLSMEELAEEVKVLEGLGHKRLALEVGEDPLNCPIDYILESINAIYSVKLNNGSIRRINVNIAATTEDNYRRLKAANIGTYILFQETYHRPTYEKLHSKGPKRNYIWHLTAMDRAMRAGIEDVGIGVLYGLYDYRYETIAMLVHAEHLEAEFGVGPHTVSVPRLRKAENVDLSKYQHYVSDEQFKKIVAILRLSLPYVGLILSTREEAVFRDEVIALGISQISAGSCTGVGGYVSNHEHEHEHENYIDKPQFEVGDHRSPQEIIKSLIKGGYIPSYCTACYREGRTGDRFMTLAKSGSIHQICEPNALITLKEYLIDYGDDESKRLGAELINSVLDSFKNDALKNKTKEKLAMVESGVRDIRF